MSDERFKDRPRGRGGRREEHHQQVAEPPPLKRPPRMFPLLAVPGSITVRAHSRRAGALIEEDIHIASERSVLKPGTVASWVLCPICEATWRGEYLQDGRPVLEGGVVQVRVYQESHDRTFMMMVRCRCLAGQRLSWLRDPTPGEWARAVARRRHRSRLGLNMVTDEDFIIYLVAPRGPWFTNAWESRVERFVKRGVEPRVAWRRAYLRCLEEIFR